jgi:hypothetical protein
MKHITTEVAGEVNAKAKVLAQGKQQTLSEFVAEVLTKEVNRLWENRPEEEGSLRIIVREELARVFE